MKKQIVTLSVLVALATLASVTSNAQPLERRLGAQQNVEAPAPVPVYPNAITVQNNADHAVWITIYNMFGSIRDAACVKVGDLGKFHNYFGPGFKVRGEVTREDNCEDGTQIFDTNIGVSMPITGSGVGVSLENGSPGRYYFN